MNKVCHPDVTIVPQRECRIGHKVFYLDFVLSNEKKKKSLGIECDGKEFHQVTTDSIRDTAILQSGAVQEIVRIPGRDIWFRVHDVFQMISTRSDWVFSLGGLVNIRVRAEREHLCCDTWAALNGTIYETQARQYLNSGEEDRIHYSPEAWEFRPTKLLWASQETILSAKNKQGPWGHQEP